MIIEYVRYRVPEAEMKAFVGAMDRAQASLALADECRAWEMARGVEEPDTWVLRIEWASLDAHQTGFRTGPHYPDFMRPLRRFNEYLIEAKHFKVSEVNARK
jgi:quinol monooxygenase YgiN